MTGPQRDPYAILGVPRGASRSEMTSAFRRLAKQTHPDAGGQSPNAMQEMQELNWAWNLLSNPVRRSDWDRSHPGAALTGSHWSAASDPLRPGPPARTADWATPPPWTVSGEPWAGADTPAVGRRSGIGCIGMLLGAFLLAALVLFGALASPYPRQPVDGAAESQP
ncbi:MAG: J domain-containing protein [Chloroflexota bacterium]